MLSYLWQDEDLCQEGCFAWLREWTSAPAPHHNWCNRAIRADNTDQSVNFIL